MAGKNKRMATTHPTLGHSRSNINLGDESLDAEHERPRPKTTMSMTRTENKKTAPGFSFGGAGVHRDNFNRGQLKTPGPGAYRHETGAALLSQAGRPSGGRFGTAERAERTLRKQYQGPGHTPMDAALSPGPGAYSLKPALGGGSASEVAAAAAAPAAGETAPRAPAYSFAPRPGTTPSRPRGAGGAAAAAAAHPGPGHYGRVDPYGHVGRAEAHAFGAAGRDFFSNQYPGAGLAHAAVMERRARVKLRNPYDPQEAEARLRERCEPALGPPLSAVGPQVAKPSAPAFTFTGRGGGGDGGAPRPGTAAAAAAEFQGTGIWSVARMEEQAARRAAAAAEDPDGEEAGEYAWLNAYAKPKKRSPYRKVADGSDMPKSRDFHKPPEFSFSKSKRFEGGGLGKVNSPGPIYSIPNSVGSDGPAFSFPKVTDRDPPEIARARKAGTPGPGAYDLSLEQRLDRWVDESLGGGSRPATVGGGGGGGGGGGRAAAAVGAASRAASSRAGGARRGIAEQSVASSLTGLDRLTLGPGGGGGGGDGGARDEDGFSEGDGGPRSDGGGGDGPEGPDPAFVKELKQSLRQDARSVYTMAETLNLKFGPLPTREKAPSFGFGTGTREMRTRHFAPGELNRELTGQASPGPLTGQRGLDLPVRPRPAQYSFGGQGVERNPVPRRAQEGPGPAHFVGRTSGLGGQSVSGRPTSPEFSFGTSQRSDGRKIFTPGFESPQRETPGPVYNSQKVPFKAKIGPKWVKRKTNLVSMR